MLACHAILLNRAGVLTGKLCRNYAMEGSNFCMCHQDIGPIDHKHRWMRKFILAADGKPFLFQHDERKKHRILGDLRDGIIELTHQDILTIPDRDRYMDIYVLLFQNGYLDLTSKAHNQLYTRCCNYLTRFLYLTNNALMMPFTDLATLIMKEVILKDADHLHFFLQFFPVSLNTVSFQGDLLQTRIVSISAFLSLLLESDAAKDLSWEPFRDAMNAHYETTLGKDHLVTSYLREVYMPEFLELYRDEKHLQKQSIDALKEELMMVCWHPDRFMIWCLDEEEKAENRMIFG
jgi:hypothetical protein